MGCAGALDMNANDISFEAALSARVDQMCDACTRCGKCVEACPSVKPAGLEDAAPQDVIGGIIDIVRTGEGAQSSRQWAQSCMLSGECIKACDEGVNPRFLLAMARVAIAKAEHHLPERRRQGVEKYRDLGRDVTVLSRLQLEGEVLERLGQKSASVATPTERPDFVFYTGCNVLKTPHIALLALDIMDALGISYQVMGGPSHCCGVVQLSSRRRRNVRPHGHQHRRKARAVEIRPGDLVVPQLLCAVHGNDAAGNRAPARRAAVRDHAVHAFP
jgi:heterodisulfide reductase subunit D